MATNDILWKGIIEDLLEEFSSFFFPEIDFDLEREFQFLESELNDLYLKEGVRQKTRRVDKLIRLFTKTGEERWVLIHVEVQGYKDNKFTERVFQYFYRIYDAYKIPVSSLVIYTDPNPRFTPSFYRYELFGTELIFSFPYYKVIHQDRAELARSDNPFAVVVMTVLEAIRTRRLKPEKLVQVKLNLVRNLLKHRISEEKIRKIWAFIHFYYPIRDEKWNSLFIKEVETIANTNNTNMGVIEIIQQQAIEEGMEIGKEIGEEIGEERGRAEEREKMNFTATKNMLHKEFSVSAICDILEVTPEFVKKVKQSLRKTE